MTKEMYRNRHLARRRAASKINHPTKNPAFISLFRTPSSKDGTSLSIFSQTTKPAESVYFQG